MDVRHLQFLLAPCKELGRDLGEERGWTKLDEALATRAVFSPFAQH